MEKRVGAGRKSELIVTQHLANLGFIVENLNKSGRYGDFPPVDLLVTAPVRFCVDIKVRIVRSERGAWISQRHFTKLVEFQKANELPVLLSFVFYVPHYFIGFDRLDSIVVVSKSFTRATLYLKDKFNPDIKGVVGELK